MFHLITGKNKIAKIIKENDNLYHLYLESNRTGYLEHVAKSTLSSYLERRAKKDF